MYLLSCVHHISYIEETLVAAPGRVFWMCGCSYCDCEKQGFTANDGEGARVRCNEGILFPGTIQG